MSAIMAVIPFTFPTGTGTFDITDATQLGGQTPVAALFITNRTTALDTEIATSGLCIGMTDGVSQYLYGQNDVDNQASSTTRRRSSITDCAGAFDAVTGSTSNFETRAQFDSFITNGIRLNKSVGSIASRGIAILFAGPSVQGKVGLIATTFDDSPALDVNTVGFNPDILFMMDRDALFWNSDTSSTADGILAFGIATRNGEQMSFSLSQNTGAATGGNQKTRIDDNVVMRLMDDTGADKHVMTVSAFDGSGFSIQTAGSTTSNDIPYLAINLAGDEARLVTFTTPTSTGVVSTVSGLDIDPAYAFGVASTKETINDSSPLSATTDSSNFAFFGFNDDVAASLSYRSNISDPSDTGDYSADEAISIGDASSPVDIVATLDTFTTGGVDMNFSNINADPKYGFMLLVGPSGGTPAPATGLPIFFMAGG